MFGCHTNTVDSPLNCLLPVVIKEWLCHCIIQSSYVVSEENQCLCSVHLYFKDKYPFSVQVYDL